MLQDFEKEQPTAFKVMKNAILKNRCSHAYLIEAKEYTRKNDIIFAFARYLLCPSHHLTQEEKQNCPICTREIENLVDLKRIEAEGLWIKKAQLETLQNDFGKKPIEGSRKVYIIEEADKLNASSANSILKFLEEPEEGIVALLMVDNIYQVLPTIVSRCQIIELRGNDWKKEISTFEKIKEIYHISELDEKKEEIFTKEIEKIPAFATYLEINGQASILHENKIWLDIFQSKEDMIFGLTLLLYFYKDALNYKCDKFLEIFESYQKEIIKVANINTISSLCDKINIIMNARDSIKYNLNLNLILDHLIYEMEEVRKCLK